MLPFGGEGAKMGMSDEVELANLLFDLYSESQYEITTVFEKYHQSRKGPCKAATNVSRQNGLLCTTRASLSTLFATFAELYSRLDGYQRVGHLQWIVPPG